MKILLAGSFEKSPASISTVYFMRKALKDLGQEIIPFDYHKEREKYGNKKMRQEMINLTKKGDQISSRWLKEY